MTETQTSPDRELKARLRAVWALGNYTAVATEIIPGLGPVLVEACAITDRDEVLDVAAGTGNAAIPAAETGANVTASDLTPELLESGKRIAQSRGAHLSWVMADAESLPFADGSFDAVISCVGVMFAPHHGQAASEMARVCRPGGRIGLINWTPEGFIGRMFATMKPYAPPPPPGAQPPPLWGNPEHVESLLAGKVQNFTAARRTLRVDRFETPADFLGFFKTNYGPTIAVYKSLGDSPDRAAALDAELLDLVSRFSSGAGTTAMDWEYLLVTARRA
ncbi:class I SAM-dependent methyltransferase [Arthrobacter sp. zg-Y877]|uniref:class I SAM-dependent methyltransferase n=1 Tax=Arthrobacter sp. zg-Y877 TaxID=3049074 RepID=UPI0025A3B751|nr:class I SAM-dependent methyltransferase [Arthrobacter sp. zg-Y877]MDM7989323.1 class I SAM-dependent methyltransferase [Arthrobacter sp. zg-Y877]